MNLSSRLLFSEEQFYKNDALNSSVVNGSYNTLHFAIRLSAEIRRVLETSDFYPELIQASSTVMHENIHWWQHIGSNFGFIFSLSYPSFCHSSRESIENLIKKNLAFKSIKKLDEKKYQKTGLVDDQSINYILNNYYDIKYAKEFALDNKNIINIIKDKRFFLTIGHCYYILWITMIEVLLVTIDEDNNFLPKIKNWLEEFKKMEEYKINGFYINSPITISHIGIKAIYEGQAAFNQFQYVTGKLNKDLTYEDFEKTGRLYGIYTEAFELFLKITQIKRPDSLLDPIVGLFLLVCDVSINPNNGFPLEIYDYENFITKNDPGIRFENICKVIAENPDKYISTIVSYSKNEYITLSKYLNESIGCKCSYESIKEILNWGKYDAVSEVLNEEKELYFSEENTVIRMIFSKYFRYQEDKLEYPNVFCWIGYHSTPENEDIHPDVVGALFKKHYALFQDAYDGEIKPTLFDHSTDEKIRNSFIGFYTHTIIYDLIYKWVEEEGGFDLNYRWLVNERNDDLIPKIKNVFEKTFGISLDSIKVL